MKINSININGNTMTIVTDLNIANNKVFMDTMSNYKNKYSNKDEDHSYVLTGIIDGNTLTVDLTTAVEPVDTRAFTILVDGVMGFYYDEKELYYKEVELLTEYCSTCLDNHQKEKMSLLIMKQRLLLYATEHGLAEDQLTYYRDIMRLLRIDSIYNIQPVAKASTTCTSCANGICTLC